MSKILISLSVALFFLMSTSSRADTAPARVDDDHDGIDDRLEQALAERYAPIIFIEPDESNYPVNVEWFLRRAHLQYHEDCTIDIDDDSGYNPIMNDNDRTTQDSLIGPLGQNIAFSHGQECGSDDTGYSHPPHHRLSTISPDPSGQWSVGRSTTGYSDQQAYVLPDLADSYHVGSTDPREWKTYFHVYPSKGGGVMVQYWHLFAYNELAVLNQGNHGGDWDASIQVQLDENLKLAGVWFSRHSNDHPGTFLAAGSPHLHLLLDVQGGRHTLMSIDGGGHAAFADLDDYCHNSATTVETTIVLPSDYGDPTNLENLYTANANPEGCGPTHSSDNRGFGAGILWETWTDGKVRTTNVLEHPLVDVDGARTHGGMVNLGEYNPCPRGDDSRCYESWQESTLLAGQFYPLNEQVFIRYSGRWGSLGSFLSDEFGFGVSPRGPVFQGYDDRGSNSASYYTAWYNQGADSPAVRGASPWLVGPASILTIGNPIYVGFNNALLNGKIPNPNTYVSSRTPFTISAKTSDDATKGGYHGVESGYRFYPSPPGTGGPVNINPFASAGAVQSSSTVSSAVPYNSYAGPFTLSGAEGMYNVDYYSLDGLDNGEVPKTKVVVLDGTPPSVTITAPAARAVYTHDMTLTLNYSAKDSGSGLASSTASMDRQATVGNHGLRSGQGISLLTEMALGSHTFKIDALDRVGNVSSVPAFFQIIATTQSIKNDVTRLFSSRAISSSSERNKLMNELDTAAAAYAGATCATAYQPFVDEVQRQRGEGIQANAADIMIGDAQYLTAQCHRGL